MGVMRVGVGVVGVVGGRIMVILWLVGRLLGRCWLGEEVGRCGLGKKEVGEHMGVK
jgi:hypothetical protein